MTHTFQTPSAGFGLRGGLVWMACLALLAAVCGSGCSGRSYRATSLPSHFEAPPVRSARQVDLSRFTQGAGPLDVVYPGDLVEVAVVTGAEAGRPEAWPVRVDEGGAVNLPLVGPVMLAGYNLPAAEGQIRQAAVDRGMFRNPQVAVTIRDRRTHKVTVSGSVNKPGTYSLPSAGSDLATAISAAGGLAKEADTVVEIRSPRQPPLQVDLLEANQQGGQYFLEDGAYVMIRPRPERLVSVIGLVRKAGQFPMPDNQELRLLDAIALAGNRTMEIADSVKIVRQDPSGEGAIEIRASVAEAKSNPRANLPLAPGDVVSVEETPLTFTITTIKDFVRFGFNSPITPF